MEKTSGGGFYLHIHPEEVLVSCGVYMPERDQLLAIRRYLSEHADEYRALHKKIVKAKGMSMTDIDGALLTRMPKGFAKDDPADELVRARNWGVHATLPPSLAEEPTLLREIVKRFKLAAPLVEMLNAPIVREETPSACQILKDLHRKIAVSDPNRAHFLKKPKKTGKNLNLKPLTKPCEGLKVNGGAVLRTRMNTGDFGRVTSEGDGRKAHAWILA